MITVSITTLVLCGISFCLGCLSLGMSLSILINMLVDRHYDKKNEKLISKQKSEKSNNYTSKSY